MTVFAVTMVRGPSWNDALAIREQPGWDDHARFMETLVRNGFVVFGVPIGDQRQVLLVVEAAGPSEVYARMAGDPWAIKGLLEVSQVRPWSIWLGGRSTADSNS
jgi:hypothetical protein